MVRVYGRLEHNIQYESLIFNIERYVVIDVDYGDTFEYIIDYEEYINILFNSSILSDNIKNFLVYTIKYRAKNKNAIKLCSVLCLYH
jgi:hypothetical protein